MNLSDLRDELTTHADDVGPAPDLRAGVAARVLATKRRRAAVAGSVATLTVAALAVGAVASLDRPVAPTPAGSVSTAAPMLGTDGMPYRVVPDSAGDVVKDGLRLRAQSADSQLAGGAIGDLGERSLSVTWNPRTTKVSFTVECYAPTSAGARDLMVRARVGAMQGYVAMSCSPRPAPQGDLPVGGLELGPNSQGSPDVTVGTEARLRVDLVDRHNRPVTRPDVRLVAAAYELGDQRPVVDASGTTVASVPEVMEHQGYRYRFLAMATGPVSPGENAVRLQAPRGGPFLVTHGTADTGTMRSTPAYFRVDGLSGDQTQTLEGSWETTPQPSGNGQPLRLEIAEGPAPRRGTGFIAIYTLDTVTPTP